MMKESCKVCYIGVKPYKEIWDLQERLLQKHIAIKRQGNKVDNILLMVEHPPVITIGNRGNRDYLLATESLLKEKGIDLIQTNRGGDITFHGLGQLVVYPIIDLSQFSTDLAWYIRSLEQVVINALSYYNIQAYRSKGETGVWIDPMSPAKARKICAIGIRCSSWVCMHGFALNVNTDLSYFQWIVPCGINKQVTSIAKELGCESSMHEARNLILQQFEQIFAIAIINIDMNSLLSL